MPNARKKKLVKHFYFFRPLVADNKKLKAFREFLVSPLHGNSPRKAEILDALAHTIRLNPVNPESVLCDIIFPGRAHDQATTQNMLRSKLSPLIEALLDFEALLQYQQDDLQKWRYVLQAGNKKQWDRYFPWIYENKAGLAARSISGTEQFFQFQVDAFDQYDQFLTRQGKDSIDPQHRYYDELAALSHYFAISQLKLACNIYNMHLLTKSKPKTIPLLDRLIAEIRDRWDAQADLTRIYYLIFESLQNPEDSRVFTRLEKLLYERGLSFGQDEARQLFQHANNYCTRRYNHFKASGDADQTQYYLEKLVALYDFQLEKRVIFKRAKGDEYIDHGDFKNIVVLFCGKGRFAWVENFIDQYSRRILKPFRDLARNFAKGILHFFKEEFESAKQYIFAVRQQIRDSQDTYYALSVKGYYLRLLFELEEYEDCEREANNTKQVVKRKLLLPASEKQKMFQLCLHLIAICRAISGPDTTRKTKLLTISSNMASGPPSQSANWLEKKLRALLTNT